MKLWCLVGLGALVVTGSTAAEERRVERHKVQVDLEERALCPKELPAKRELELMYRDTHHGQLIPLFREVDPSSPRHW